MLLEQLAVDISHDLRLPQHVPASSAAVSHDAAASPAALAAATMTAAASPASMPKAVRETQLVEPEPDICASILSSSCLMDFLTKELKVASFTGECLLIRLNFQDGLSTFRPSNLH